MTTDTLPPDVLQHLLGTRQAMDAALGATLQEQSALHAYFTALSDADLMTRVDVCAYEPGAIIFREGDGGDRALLIWDGEVAILKGDLAQPTLLAFRGPGALIGEMSLLDDEPRSATVAALSTVRALCINRSRFEDFLREVPALGLSIMVNLTQRLRKAHQDQLVQKTVIQQLTGQLERAGREQAAILPGAAPRLQGWEFSVTLTPVWQTSGDFYDFLALDDHRLGLLVADVADKGSGAAMYMALACTLLRTYAHEYPGAPELVLEAASNRLLADTASDGFVTVFYGVLDLTTGELTYANAGHNPGFLVCPSTGETQALVRTGVPLGMIPDRQWERATVTIQPDDRLVLYTDGINEAANVKGDQFGEKRIVRLAQSYAGEHAHQLRDALIAAVGTFVGGAVQGDDMTLLVGMRR